MFKQKTKSHQDLPALKGKSVMENLELPNLLLLCVDVAQSVPSLKGPLANNLWFGPLY